MNYLRILITLAILYRYSDVSNYREISEIRSETVRHSGFMRITDIRDLENELVFLLFLYILS